MRMTQAAVDYRSTEDERAGLMQEPLPGIAPAEPAVPDIPVEGWYAPPPPVPPSAQPSPAARSSTRRLCSHRGSLPRAGRAVAQADAVAEPAAGPAGPRRRAVRRRGPRPTPPVRPPARPGIPSPARPVQPPRPLARHPPAQPGRPPRAARLVRAAPAGPGRSGSLRRRSGPARRRRERLGLRGRRGLGRQAGQHGRCPGGPPYGPRHRGRSPGGHRAGSARAEPAAGEDDDHQTPAHRRTEDAR